MQIQHAITENFLFLELHYYFYDDSHAIDAFVQNKCETQLLGIVKDTATLFNVSLIIEIEPAVEGGYTQRFRISERKGNKPATTFDWKSAIFGAAFVIVGAVVVKGLDHSVVGLTNPIQDSTERMCLKNAILDNIIKQHTIRTEETKDSLEFENERETLELKLRQLHDNPKISKKKAKFYRLLEKYPKVARVSIQVFNSNNVSIIGEQSIEKNEFSGLSVDKSNMIYLNVEHNPNNVNDSISSDTIKDIINKGLSKPLKVRPIKRLTAKPNTHNENT